MFFFLLLEKIKATNPNFQQVNNTALWFFIIILAIVLFWLFLEFFHELRRQ